MANQEQLAILKQGVEVWNKWREENSKESINLSEVKLKEASLHGVNLHQADLYETNLKSAYLSEANLSNTFLSGANLNEVDLSSANLSGANLRGVDLSYANLREANLSGADLFSANLIGVNLTGANLCITNFHYTLLSNLTLDNVINLDTIYHSGPSTLDISVFQQTKTPLPKSFTRGCGWQDWMVKSMELQKPNLTPDQVVDILYEVEHLRNNTPIQLHNLFISHSRKDAAFIEHIGKVFEQRNILYWLDVRDGIAGPLEKQIDRAIRLNEIFLLVLSKHSAESDWVELEIDLARKVEKESGRNVICPIAIDNEWRNGNLSERIKLQIEKYNVLDFSRWQDPMDFNNKLERLLQGLNLFYKTNV
ncbi:MAG: toll/interleukin-1 receptor domain-containing protein [Saprospiraceae bacterium]|nr:toll/interleukin-1 receptor domain-containing protein [Saprospiraceae bacterium]